MPLRRSPIWSDPLVKPPFGSVEVDWAHPLTRGMVGCWLFNEAAGPPYDLVNRNRAVLLNAPPWGSGPRGVALSLLTASAQSVQAGNISPYQITGAQITVICSLTETAVASQIFVAKDKDTGGRPFTMDRSGNNVRFYVDGGAVAIASGSHAAAVSGILAGTYDSSDTLTGTRIYKNGGLLASGDVTGSIPSGTANLTFGAREYSGAEGPMSGQIYFVLLANVAWTPAMLLQHYLEPYAVLRPIVPRRYFVPSGAGAVAVPPMIALAPPTPAGVF